MAPSYLNSRPLVIPESSDILIHLPEYARSNARISFDGKKALRMRKVRSVFNGLRFHLSMCLLLLSFKETRLSFELLMT